MESEEFERLLDAISGLKEAVLAGLREEVAKPKPLLNEKETADLLGIKGQTLAIWRSRGVGPSWVKIEQRRVMYRLEDIERYIAEQLVRH